VSESLDANKVRGEDVLGSGVVENRSRVVLGNTETWKVCFSLI
jgi:hypothetical protein